MTYPFSVVGNKVQVNRCIVQAVNFGVFKVGSRELAETISKGLIEEHGAAIGANKITDIDPIIYASAEWMDGLEVADVPDTYAEAVRIFEMGSEAYEAELAADPEADRDELLLDLAVRLTLLEMGVNG